KQDGEHALQEADKFIASRPSDPFAHGARGEALIALGREAEAIRELDAVIKTRPTAEAYLMRSKAYGLANGDKALADVTSALRLKPHSAAIYDVKADFYLAKGELAPAIAALDEAIRLQPLNSEYVAKRLSALEDSRQYDRAADSLSQFLAQKPNDS